MAKRFNIRMAGVGGQGVLLAGDVLAAVCLSAGLGLGTAILNNVQDVRNWQTRTFVGDFFVRAIQQNLATNDSAPMPESLKAVAMYYNADTVTDVPTNTDELKAAIEGGARAGMVAPDDKTYAYLKGRHHAPSGEQWVAALAHWRTLPSDPDAVFDAERVLECGTLAPGRSDGRAHRFFDFRARRRQRNSKCKDRSRRRSFR